MVEDGKKQDERDSLGGKILHLNYQPRVSPASKKQDARILAQLLFDSSQ